MGWQRSIRWMLAIAKRARVKRALKATVAPAAEGLANGREAVDGRACARTLGPSIGKRVSNQFHIEESAVPVTLEQREGCTVLRLEGAVDISAATELKKLMVQALAPPSANSAPASAAIAAPDIAAPDIAAPVLAPFHVSVSVQGATELDVTAVQLLWAAAREAKGGGVSLVLDGGVPEPIAAALDAAGFPEFPVPVEVR